MISSWFCFRINAVLLIGAGFNLERGKQREIEHLSTEKLKQITDYENIKYEQSQEQIKPAPINNTTLVLQQNQELIKYTNKLKL